MELFDDALRYARVSPDDETAKGIFKAAEAYITGAIDEKDAAINETNPVYRLAVCLLFAHWYDNREADSRFWWSISLFTHDSFLLEPPITPVSGRHFQ